MLAASATGALAQKKYDTGATDTEIKIGNIMPYSGPASAYGVIGKTEAAYFKMVNAEGGINGRKINFISSTTATARRRRSSRPASWSRGRGAADLQAARHAAKPAIQKYMNPKKVPQLFVATGATKWDDPKNFPWTMGWQPNYQTEGADLRQVHPEEHPNAKIGVLYQNDDYGKDYLKGFKDGLGGRPNMIVKEETYEVTDPTSTPRSSSSRRPAPTCSSTSPRRSSPRRRSARRARSAGSRCSSSTTCRLSVGAVLKPAGFEAARASSRPLT